jgi:hypothetical protein
MLLQIIRNRWKGPTDYNIWAVKKDVSLFEKQWGDMNRTKIVEADLTTFVPRLEEALFGTAEAA